MKTDTTIVASALAVVCLLRLVPAGQAQGCLNYATNNGTITITDGCGCADTNGVVSIPSSINGLPVTSIGDNAFYNCAGLTNITIPDTVTNIGHQAFEFCAGLVNIALPDSVTSIGDWAFYECFGLTNVVIGSNVTSIGSDAFAECYHLPAFVIPSSVTTIESEAFFGCSGLTSITIPSSVGSIWQRAFAACGSLTNISVDPLNPLYSSVGGVLLDKSQTTLIQCPGGTPGGYTIPNSVIIIGAQAFAWCASLTSVTIPRGVATVGGPAFDSCSGLTNISVDPLNPSYSSAGGLLFDKAQTVLVRFPGGLASNYTIPNSVTTFGDWAFSDCVGLTNVTIPNSVTNIGIAAFWWCTHLTNVTINAGLTAIGASAFESCFRLTSVTLPNSVTTIGNSAFWDCTGLTNVTIGSGLASIEDYVFSYCSSLTGVYFYGNTPALGGGNVFSSDNATVYFLPGTTGWGPTFGGLPTASWLLPNPVILNNSPSFGVRTNQFGFIISWATNTSVAVEACTNLAICIWFPVSTNTLTDGTSYFGDPQWATSPRRFYRLRSL